MAYRPLSVASDFTEDLFFAFKQARDAGLEMDQIESIVRKQLDDFEKDLAEFVDDDPLPVVVEKLRAVTREHGVNLHDETD